MSALEGEIEFKNRQYQTIYGIYEISWLARFKN